MTYDEVRQLHEIGIKLDAASDRLATLQAENAEMRNALDRRGPIDALAEKLTENGRRIDAALAKTIDDLEARATAAEGERDRLAALAARDLEAYAKLVITLGDVTAKLTTTEGERDRLRDVVADIARPNGVLCRTCGDTVVRCAADTNPGDECPGKLARAFLAAIPHTEGEACEGGHLWVWTSDVPPLCSGCGIPCPEASAPPKERTP